MLGLPVSAGEVIKFSGIMLGLPSVVGRTIAAFVGLAVKPSGMELGFPSSVGVAGTMSGSPLPVGKALVLAVHGGR